MFRFWYKFIPENNILIQRNMPEAAWNNIHPRINEYMGKVFENICADYLLENYTSLPVQFQNLGRWWGNNPKLKREEEIDYVLKVLPEVIRKLNKISPYQRELKVLEEKFKAK